MWCRGTSRYGLVHGKLLRSLRLWQYNNPAAHAEYGMEHVLQLPHWHVEESIAVLDGPMGAAAAAAADAAEAAAGATAAAAGPVAVWEFLRDLGRGMALEVLVYGNSTEQQARGGDTYWSRAAGTFVWAGVCLVADTRTPSNRETGEELALTVSRGCSPGVNTLGHLGSIRVRVCEFIMGEGKRIGGLDFTGFPAVTPPLH
jgi:hypothetical protein